METNETISNERSFTTSSKHRKVHNIELLQTSVLSIYFYFPKETCDISESTRNKKMSFYIMLDLE